MKELLLRKKEIAVAFSSAIGLSSCASSGDPMPNSSIEKMPVTSKPTSALILKGQEQNNGWMPQQRADIAKYQQANLEVVDILRNRIEGELQRLAPEWEREREQFELERRNRRSSGRQDRSGGRAYSGGRIKDLNLENATQKEVEDDMRAVFKDKADIMIAISREECPPAHPDYPYCVNTKYPDDSYCHLQINLLSDYNYKLVPGKDHSEKVIYLMNYKNCNIIGNQLLQTERGFNHWTMFTNGRYKQNLTR